MHCAFGILFFLAVCANIVLAKSAYFSIDFGMHIASTAFIPNLPIIKKQVTIIQKLLILMAR